MLVLKLFHYNASFSLTNLKPCRGIISNYSWPTSQMGVEPSRETSTHISRIFNLSTGNSVLGVS